MNCLPLTRTATGSLTVLQHPLLREAKGLSMVLILTREGAGINPFFPFLISPARRYIRVVDWLHYQRWLPWLLGANAGLLTVFFFLAMQESPEQWTDVYTLASCAQFGYIGWRIFSVRKTTILDLKQGAIAAGAPLVVWLETMSLAAGFLMAAQTGLRFAESGADHWLFWLMEVFCAVLLLMPLLNFLTLGRYKKKNQKK